MESYEIYKRVKKIGDEKMELSAEGGNVCIEKMQDQYEMTLMNGVVLIIFDSMDCVDSEHIEFYLGGMCVANLDTSKIV